MQRRGNRRKLWSQVLGWTLNVVALLYILLAHHLDFVAAIQTERNLLANVENPIPEAVTLENFEMLIFGVDEERAAQDLSFRNRFPPQIENFPTAFRNSAIVAISTGLATIAMGSLSAYTLVRLRYPGRDFFGLLLLATRMVPLIVLVIPLFIRMRDYNLLNTLEGMILAQTGFLLPFTVWMLRAYFDSLPGELEDAARVDGCTRLGSFWRVVLPLSMPGIAATFVITFLLAWNDFLIPITLGGSEDVQTLPVLISSFISDTSLQYTVVNATALLVMLPTVILALLLQRYVVAGLTAGALKG
ncbi:MAG: carbohydrate ABC transporter permease [Anaerolineae bacterium]|nr:carbohydrate ABC transporter permease [Anaerolineae bacterium]